MAVAVTGSYKMFRDPLSWKPSSDLNYPRMDLGVAGDTDNALAFGGVYRVGAPSNPNKTNEVFGYTEEWNGSSWSNTNYMNTARGGHSGFGSSNAAVAANGNTGISNASPSLVYSATTETDCTEEWNGTSWSAVNATNQCSFYKSGTGTQNAGIIAGGNEQTGITAECSVEWYDGTSWSNRPILNYPVAGHAIVGNQEDAYIFGGACILRWFNPSTSGYTECYTNTTQALIGGWSWNTQPNLNNNRSNLSGVGTQNAALAFGGHADQFPLACTEEWNGTTWSNVSSYSTVFSRYCNVYGQTSMGAVGELGDSLTSGSKILSIGGTRIEYLVPPNPLNPTSKNYLLVSSSIETGSIAQGLIEGGTNEEKISFNPQITDSTASIYDTTYAQDIDTVSDVSESLQWRNYPIQEQCIVSASFDEIFFPQNDSGDSEITIATYFLNPCATGSVQASVVYGEINNPESDDFIVIPWGTSSAAFGISAYTASNNTTFKGWSTVKPVTIFGGLFPVYNLLSTSQNVDIEPQEENQTYYAIFDCDVEEKVYCYTTSSNKNDICLECQEEKTIFFNKTKYQTSGSEEITWYEDIDLTTTASDGYYYLSGSENPIVYDLTTGSAIFEIICEGGVVYCSYPPGYFPTPTPTVTPTLTATPTLTPTLTATPTLTPTSTV